ncbi:MAG TPA: hypothetical protein VNW46_13920 [Gemmatimonadaceae bacterium]|nr:hypothetical protein [Gemmatimonadaceae bacterium]
MLAAAGVIAAAAGPPSRWKVVARTADVTMSIDSTRIDRTRADHMIGIWLRFDFPAAVPDSSGSGALYKRVDVRLAVDCRQQLVRNVSDNVVDSTGAVIRSDTFDSTAAPQSFASHPFNDSSFAAVCAWLAPARVRSASP